MNKKLLFILFFSFSIIVNGQTWAPTGAKWSFGLSCWDYPSPAYIDFNEWISMGDTIVAGQICKLIKSNTEEMLTYEESNVVYWNHENQFTVLYDFNKNAGESWTILNDTCNLIINVDSTGMETINGFDLKTLYVSTADSAYMGKIIQHIGHVGIPYPDFEFHCTGAVTEFGCSYAGLRCYEDSAFSSYSFGIAPSCDYSEVGIEDFVNPELSFYPNPTTGIISISGLTEKAKAVIMDTMGRTLLETDVINNKVDVSLLANGFYLLRVEIGKGLSNLMLIKQ